MEGEEDARQACREGGSAGEAAGVTDTDRYCVHVN